MRGPSAQGIHALLRERFNLPSPQYDDGDPMANPRAREPRQMAMLKVKMADGAEWVDVTLANISPTGFMARSSVIPAVGSSVHIQHRGAILKGEVVWATRTRFGVRSDGEIDLSALLGKSALDAKASLGTPKRKALWHWRSR